MKAPTRLENDWHEHSRAEKVILVIVLAIVVLVLISWVSQGFPSNGVKGTIGDSIGSDPSRTIGHKASVSTNVIQSEGKS